MKIAIIGAATIPITEGQRKTLELLKRNSLGMMPRGART